MLVSAIMPAYNAERYVEQALQSLLGERGDFRLDIIVVDDGSTDNTARIVQELADQHAEIRFFSAPHCGIASTRNRALDAIPPDAEFVTFLDADDLVYPGRIDRQLQELIANPEAEMAYGLLQWFDVVDDVELRPAATARTETQLNVQLSVALFRRSLIDRIGRFDDSLVQAEDTDYLLRIAESGARVIVEDKVATFYRRHDLNVTNDRLTMKREFMKAIHRSVRRRRNTSGESSAMSSGASLFQNPNLSEWFNVCPSRIAS